METRYKALSSEFINWTSQGPNRLSTTNDVFTKPMDTQNINELVDEAVEMKLESRNTVLFGVPEGSTTPNLEVVHGLLSMLSDEHNFELITPTDILCTFQDGPKVDNQPHFLKIVYATSQTTIKEKIPMEKARERPDPKTKV
uniref:Uncharacterized protein n=1 Tax=Romanomermis culicivorax TaxID=13658 RepID=A0A915K7R9_ROMCU